LRDGERDRRCVKDDAATYQKRDGVSLWIWRVLRLLLGILIVGFSFGLFLNVWRWLGFGLGTTFGGRLAASLGLVGGLTVLGGWLAASLWLFCFFAFLWRGLCLDWAARDSRSLARSGLCRSGSAASSGDAIDLHAVFFLDQVYAVPNGDRVLVAECLSNGRNVDLMKISKDIYKGYTSRKRGGICVPKESPRCS
jgi:hypothetical protein